MASESVVDVVLFFDPAEKGELKENLTQALDVLGRSYAFYSSWDESAAVFETTNPSYKLIVLDPLIKGFHGSRVQTYLETREEGQETSLLLCTQRNLGFIAEIGIDCFEDLVSSDGRIIVDSLPHEIAFALKRVFFKEAPDDRKDPRAVTCLTVHYSTDPESSPGVARVLNISKGGLFIETDKPLPERSLLNLKLELPDQKGPIECTGRVAYYHQEKTDLRGLFPSGVGIEFKGINDVDRWRIYHHVQGRLLRIDRMRYLNH